MEGKTGIKICGLLRREDVEIVNKNKADFAGFVLFFEKSRRCIEISKAKDFLQCLAPSIKSVAVTVSPSLEQMAQIEETGFDFLQVHGILRPELLSFGKIPILRAVNLSGAETMDGIERSKRIAGYVCDGEVPGSGRAFDWECLKPELAKLFYLDGVRNHKMFLLAGGLYPENVEEAIRILNPDIVDVSSGVELSKQGSNGKSLGKDAGLVQRFCENVRNVDRKQKEGKIEKKMEEK